MDIYGNDDTTFEISDSKWKKLAFLKQSAILSYAHIVLTKELFETVKYDSKYEIIDLLVSLGFTDDIIASYY